MSQKESREEIFADTCILLNFVQREWERNHSQELIESDKIEVVVSLNVLKELEEVTKRRRDIYEDFLDLLQETEEGVEEYNPADRRVYIGGNDRGHIREMQMQLSNLDNRAEVLRRLRRFIRAVARRIEYLQTVLEENTVDPLAPYSLELALSSLLDHGADARIVTDAAGWTTDGGSGVMMTLDSDDLLDHEAEIVDLIHEEQGPDWIIEIRSPEEVISELIPATSNK